MVRYSVHVELWNPYSSAFVPEDLELEISGLPTIVLKTEVGLRRTIDLQEVFGEQTGGGEHLSIRLPFTETEFDGTDDRSWLPGRIYSWIGPNNYSNTDETDAGVGKFYSRSLNESIWEVPTGQTFPPPKPLPFGIEATASLSLTVRLKQSPENGGAVLAEYRQFAIDDFNQPPGKYDPKFTSFKFGYRFRLIEAGDVLAEDPWLKSQWLRRSDPRNSMPESIVKNASGNYFPPLGLDPTGYTNTSVKQLDYLFDRTAGRTGKHFMEDVPLFELPRQPHLSVGALQHLHVLGERPYQIGNSWGSENGKPWNILFDRYFFSGLTDAGAGSAVEDGAPLPNTRLRLFSGESGPVTAGQLVALGGESSRSLLVDGAFNINSVSARVWEGVLTSVALRQWQHVNLDDRRGNNTGDQHKTVPTVETDLGYVFFRFPQSIQETYELGPKRHEIYSNQYVSGQEEPPTEFFRRGARALRRAVSEEDMSEYRLLAEAIAGKIKERTERFGPYLSMESFLSADPLFPDPDDSGANRSAIESAIAEVDSLWIDENGEEIYHHPPHALTQADVLGALAPIANVRSDSFLIRSYGDVVNEATGQVEGRAWCEAYVQRIPDPVESSDDYSRPNEDGFGRKFQVVYFRWLDSADI
jgi:hypothetical protein